MNKIYVKNPSDWCRWLADNHDRTPDGIWLVFYKKAAKKPTLSYEQAVEEALCYGWIDSIIKKIDEASYVRKFTPRKAESCWSASNRKRVTRLIKEGRMTPFGLSKVNQAKASGLWDQDGRPNIDWDIPEDLQTALNKNKKARAFFDRLAPTYRKQFVAWIRVAKREETKQRRVKEAIVLLARGEKLGLK